MIDIDKVKGILISPNGQQKSFGVHKYEDVNNLDENNLHDAAFRKDIVSSEWFKKLQDDLHFRYLDDTIYRNSERFASKGIVTILNASFLINDNSEFNSYFVIIPEVLTDRQEEIFADSYDYLKDLIQRRKGKFEAVAIDPVQREGWKCFDIDEFYEKIDLNRKKLTR